MEVETMRARILVLAVALAFVVALLPTHQVSAQAGMHCVQPGETLFRIAMNYHTTVGAIASANGIANPNYVRAYQCLYIPTYHGGPGPHGPGPHGPGPVPAGRYHWVCPGETLFAIGRLYGVSPWSIAAANGLTNPNYIRAGQRLYIP
jgi:spore germination protein